MSIKKDLRQLLHPYYMLNIILSCSYLFVKKFPVVCEYTFPNWESKCELDSRESEILFFLVIIVTIRSRKSGTTSMVTYLTSSFMYCKVANAILFFYADFRLGLLYLVAFVFIGIFFPEPTYSGPENITYFRGAQGLEDELSRDKRVTWLVAFYTMWNPTCISLAPVFSKISADYHTEKLRFGKVDIGRFPEASQKFKVSDAATSKQLPSLILFQNGKEVTRRPYVDGAGKIQKFFFSEDNIRVTFDLNNIYEQSKKKDTAASDAKKKIQ